MTDISVQELRLSQSSGFELGPIDLRLRPGSRTAVIGPSGSGKTTLLRCLARLLQPDAGSVQMPQRIGFVFQDGGLWPHMTALQHLQFVAPGHSESELMGLLAQVHIEHRAGARPAELSGGEAQRLGLARALAQDPEILLLDEPLHSVDTVLRRELSLLIRRLAVERQLTLVLVTHDRDEVLAIAEDVVVLHEGRIVEQGRTAELLQHPGTAFSAALLAEATCIPLHVNGCPHADSPLGLIELPEGVAAAAALVLLPGDVQVSPQDGVEAQVLGLQRDRHGARLVVHCAGHDLYVPCPEDLEPGPSVRLGLRGRPRVLPMLPSAGGLNG